MSGSNRSSAAQALGLRATFQTTTLIRSDLDKSLFRQLDVLQAYANVSGPGDQNTRFHAPETTLGACHPSPAGHGNYPES